jgi:hypothetical protein
MIDVDSEADFKIDREGVWFHGGARIQREALAKLFADRALKIDEEGRYWLATPYEKYPVTVEDVPFIIVDYDVRGGNLDLRTNMGETVKLGPDHPLELRDGVPYVEVRGGLYARVSRSVYYNLVEMAGATVKSRGVEFPLGEINDEAG